MMRVIFQRTNDIDKPTNIGRADILCDHAFERGQMITDAFRQFSSFTSEAHNKRPPIAIADGSRDQAAFHESIQDTCERGSFVGEPSM